MARPTKTTVDYFPHVTQTGKTIAILEARWGNDGYAFWFKTLELLGSSEGFYYDCNKAADWEYLLSKTRVTEDKATAILSKLAEIDAIDAELWSASIIWSDHFAANLGPVFDKRKSTPPVKPALPGKPSMPAEVSVTETDANVNLSEFPGEETDKVKESKVKQSKGETTTPLPPSENAPEKGDEKTAEASSGQAPAETLSKKPAKPACPSQLREGVVQQADTVNLKIIEADKLAQEVGPEGLHRIIEILDGYKTNNPDKCGRYRDDYKVIRSWVLPRYQEEQAALAKTSRASPAGESFAMQKLAAMAREAAEDDAS